MQHYKLLRQEKCRDAKRLYESREPADQRHLRALPQNDSAEFYQVAFRRKIYRSIEESQVDLDDWIAYYNNERTHQGKMCCGRTPMQTLVAILYSS